MNELLSKFSPEMIAKVFDKMIKLTLKHLPRFAILAKNFLIKDHTLSLNVQLDKWQSTASHWCRYLEALITVDIDHRPIGNDRPL